MLNRRIGGRGLKEQHLILDQLAFWTKRTDGTVLDVSEEYSRHTGISPSAIVGRNTHDAGLFESELTAAIARQDAETLERGRSEGLIVTQGRALYSTQIRAGDALVGWCNRAPGVQAFPGAIWDAETGRQLGGTDDARPIRALVRRARQAVEVNGAVYLVMLSGGNFYAMRYGYGDGVL